eukprot:GHVN01105782.1.p1 GENE.GHVN01105782.1~~GHVN01105782.1.p1  ORF type:complete len:323 (-),score=32.03 GHVN01105782.1:105-1073(-)
MGGSGSREEEGLREQLQPPPAQRVVQVGAAPQQRYIADPRLLRRSDEPAYQDWGGPLTEDSSRPSVPSMQIQPTVALYNPVYLQPDSLKLEKNPCDRRYALVFTFDAKTSVEIVVYFLAKQDVDRERDNVVKFNGHTCFRRLYTDGMKQTYRSRDDECFDLEEVSEETLDRYTLPGGAHFVIELTQASTPSLTRPDGQAAPVCTGQITYASIKRQGPLWGISNEKQCVRSGKMLYEVQAVYGIGSDNPSSGEQPKEDDAPGADVNGRECVICLTEERDTAVLPCRHMCLCSSCAKIVRMQSSKCPICRQRVVSLLQIPVNSR